MLQIAYGMTENSPVTFQGYMDDPIEKRVSTVGRPSAHTEVGYSHRIDRSVEYLSQIFYE